MRAKRARRRTTQLNSTDAANSSEHGMGENLDDVIIVISRMSCVLLNALNTSRQKSITEFSDLQLLLLGNDPSVEKSLQPICHLFQQFFYIHYETSDNFLPVIL